MRLAISMRLAIIGVMLTTLASARGQTREVPDIHAVTPLTADQLYQGWRASRLLGEDVTGPDGKRLGSVRNILVSDHGRIEALVVQGHREASEFVFRVPWERLKAEALPENIIADLTTEHDYAFGLFPGARPLPDTPHDFAISAVIGDYARLQAGQGYGYVSDVVFGGGGRLSAVLVTRDALAGGGTLAFPFPGSTGRWNPRLGYYGLPHVTAEQANRAGILVDAGRFGNENPG